MWRKAMKRICFLDPCSSWLIKPARGRLAELARKVVRASLRAGVMPSRLREAVVRLVLKKLPEPNCVEELLTSLQCSILREIATASQP